MNSSTPTYYTSSTGTTFGNHYYGARYYHSELLTSWLSVDPLSDKYPSVSPYNYCAGNPVKLVDPDGRDVWEVDENGRVINYIKDKTRDAFYRVNGNGERIEGKENYVEFPYETIESHTERSYFYKKQIGTYDAFQVRGDKNGEKLFKFLAITVADQEIEISHFKCAIEGDKGLNIVSTAHFKPVTETKEDGSIHRIASEPSQSYLWNDRLRHGYTVREINHSHPLTPYPSKSDQIMSRQIGDIYSAKHAPKPRLNIYYVKEDRYISY